MAEAATPGEAMHMVRGLTPDELADMRSEGLPLFLRIRKAAEQADDADSPIHE